MTVLADGRHVAVRGMRGVRRADLPAVRRTTEEALRRPPSGRQDLARSRATATSCVVPRERRRWWTSVAVAGAVCAVMVAVGLVIGGLANGMAGSSAEVPRHTAVVSVAPGETLWDVAQRYAPDSDPRAVVRRIEELNEVSAGEVAAGYALTVPVQPQG